MIRFLGDEDFDARILRGLRRHHPEVDFTSIDEMGLKGTADPGVLRIAANLGRVLLTHDKRTMDPIAKRLIASGFTTPGVIIVDREAQIGTIVDHLAMIAMASHEDEWRNQIARVPLM